MSDKVVSMETKKAEHESATPEINPVEVEKQIDSLVEEMISLVSDKPLWVVHGASLKFLLSVMATFKQYADDGQVPQDIVTNTKQVLEEEMDKIIKGEM